MLASGAFERGGQPGGGPARGGEAAAAVLGDATTARRVATPRPRRVARWVPSRPQARAAADREDARDELDPHDPRRDVAEILPERELELRMPLPAASGQNRLSNHPAMSDVTTIITKLPAMNPAADHLAKRRYVCAYTWLMPTSNTTAASPAHRP